MSTADLKCQSITQENDLDAFLRTAELAGTEFQAERLNVKVIPTQTTAIHPNLLSPSELAQMHSKMLQHQDQLRIPRRPAWTTETTPSELDANERNAFLEWRRQLAVLEEEYHMVVTPFERNLEVWRQLWRVLERSHVVVQIVDARNPMFFRCPDLELYVRELNEKDGRQRRNVLLVNKADFLTAEQRRQWAAHFRQQKVEFIFFSAMLATQEQEQERAEDEQELQVESDQSPHDDRQDEPLEQDETENVLADETILSCHDLIQALEAMRSDTPTVIGLVGYPNVGKSSTINALLGEKKVNVSSTPGKTKHFQTIVLTPSLTLCDCPGLVFPSFATTKAEMVVNGVLPIDQLREYISPSTLLAQRLPRWYLEWMYTISLPVNRDRPELMDVLPASQLLIAYADARGYRRAGQSGPDEARAARILLKDMVNGKLLYCEAPPGEDQDAYSAFTIERLRQEIQHYSDMNAHKLKKRPPTASAEDVQAEEQGSDLRGVDKSFFMDSEKGRVRTRGKYGVEDFHRVNVFPHQSGYVMDARLMRQQGDAATTVASMQTMNLGKKSHKLGKRRVKDRSWRAE